MTKLTCFKAYDIRGRLGEELNEDIAWRIGRAYGEYLKPKTIVLGGDVRLTSEALKLALAKGLQDAGVDVLDIGMSGTEEIYFATFHLGVDGGIEVTASHNPMDYNGMKLARGRPPDKRRHRSARRSASGRSGRLPAGERGRARQLQTNQPAQRLHRPPARLYQC